MTLGLLLLVFRSAAAVKLTRMNHPLSIGRYVRAAVLVCLGTAAACWPHRPTDPAAYERWHQDSIAYSRRLSQWLRDSMVVDSLSRAVPTDSLYRLYRAMLFAKAPRPYLEPILCLQTNLNWRYGMQPAARAINRMKDTLWKRGDPSDGRENAECRLHYA
jgi:hypothetical protein